MTRANPHIEGKNKRPESTSRMTLSGAPTKLSIREITDIDGNVQYELVSEKSKFDAEAKATVIKELATHGRIGTAARAAGVTVGTLKRHVKKDPEFAVLLEEGLEVYKDKLLNHHQKLVFEGTPNNKYDREGNLLESGITYPIRLIELELKKHDAGYRDKREVSLDVRGGVLVAPATVDSVEDWETRYGAKQVIEGSLAKDGEPEDSKN